MELQSSHSPVRRVIAFLISILGAGAGHVVVGYPVKGLMWLVVTVVAVAVLVGSIIVHQPYLVWLLFAAVVLIRIAAIIDTLRLPISPALPSNLKTTLVVLLMVAASTLTGEAALIFVHAERLPTTSMYPSIEAGDRLVVSGISGKLNDGDLIVFDYPMDPSKRYLKRIVAMAGDTVEIKDGVVILNGKPSGTVAPNEPCTTDGMKCTIWHETLNGKAYRIALMNDGDHIMRNFGPAMIPDGQLFVLGDNRDNSADSRHFGNVPIGLVQGKPQFVYWSSDETGIHWNRINQSLE